MKKIIGLLVVVIALAGVAYFLFTKNNTQQSGLALNVAKEKIGKIFMADMLGKTISLNKKNNVWYINDSLLARPDLINNILNIIRDIKPKQAVPMAEKNNVITALSSNGVKVEVYDNNNNLYETFTIGLSTEKKDGNFIFKKGQPDAYIYNVLGFDGDLSSTFVTSLQEWRSHTVVSCQPDSIANIEMQYAFMQDSSFNIKATNAAYELLNYNNTNTKAITSTKAQKYFSLFKDIKCLGFENNYAYADSIIKTQRVYGRLAITEKNNKKYNIQLYYFNANQRSKSVVNVEKNVYDPEYLFGYDGHDLFIFTIDALKPIMVSPSWFY
jgi:Domain of unknown function (DUF4340)